MQGTIVHWCQNCKRKSNSSWETSGNGISTSMSPHGLRARAAHRRLRGPFFRSGNETSSSCLDINQFSRQDNTWSVICISTSSHVGEFKKATTSPRILWGSRAATFSTAANVCNKVTSSAGGTDVRRFQRCQQSLKTGKPRCNMRKSSVNRSVSCVMRNAGSSAGSHTKRACMSITSFQAIWLHE